MCCPPKFVLSCSNYMLSNQRLQAGILSTKEPDLEYMFHRHPQSNKSGIWDTTLPYGTISVQSITKRGPITLAQALLLGKWADSFFIIMPGMTAQKIRHTVAKGACVWENQAARLWRNESGLITSMRSFENKTSLIGTPIRKSSCLSNNKKLLIA